MLCSSREAATAGFGIYIHVPFCRDIRCPYCDFFSVTGAEQHVPAYLEALERELESTAERDFPSGGTVETVYFGGGTPSVLEPGQTGRIISTVRRLWRLSPEAEITLECNPEDLDQPRAAGYRQAGANRLSIGGQSFDSGILAALGRRHGADSNRAALESARRAGFGQLSLDLIFGSPGSGQRTLLNSVKEALALGVGHLSLYGYHLDKGCRDYGNPEYEPVGEESYRTQYLAACDLLEKSGWRHYEISNWARTEADFCRHNLIYWEREKGYLGCGPSAHSFLPPAVRAWNPAHLSRWLGAVTKDKPPVRGNERLSAQAIAFEKVLLGLRLSRGVKPELLRGFLGPETEVVLEGLAAEGLVREAGRGRISLTAPGYLVFDSIVELLTLSHELPSLTKNY